MELLYRLISFLEKESQLSAIQEQAQQQINAARAEVMQVQQRENELKVKTCCISSPATPPPRFSARTPSSTFIFDKQPTSENIFYLFL